MNRVRSDLGCSGLSLVELIIAMAMSFALGTAGFLFFRSQVRSLTDQSAELDAIEGARGALDFMGYEIRQAGANPTNSASFSSATALTSASSTGLTIKYDKNGDGSAQANETVTYAYDSGSKTITRNDGTTSTLISNVPSGGLSFQYYDCADSSCSTLSASAMSGGSVTTPANVAVVLVTVQVQAARATTATTTTLSSRVTLRNRSAVLARVGVQG